MVQKVPNAMLVDDAFTVGVAAATAATTSKATPVDADLLPVVDSEAGFGLKKLTWANLKATLASWLASGAIAGSFTSLTSSGNATLGDAEATDTHAIKGATTVLANSASAALTVTQTGVGNAFVVEDSASTDSTPFVIDGAGRVLVGATSNLDVNAQVQVSSMAAFLPQGLFLNDSDSASSGYLKFSKKRTTSAVVQSGDPLGVVLFMGHDGTQQLQSSSIVAYVDGTPGTNDMPGRLEFRTTADGASNPTERMRIDSAGLITIAAGQIKFPSTQNASADANTLDDYEEGTFTPVVKDAAAGNAATTAARRSAASAALCGRRSGRALRTRRSPCCRLPARRTTRAGTTTPRTCAGSWRRTCARSLRPCSSSRPGSACERARRIRSAAGGDG